MNMDYIFNHIHQIFNYLFCLYFILKEGCFKKFFMSSYAISITVLHFLHFTHNIPKNYLVFLGYKNESHDQEWFRISLLDHLNPFGLAYF